MPKSTDQIEHTFHDEIWEVANSASRVERAVTEGRALAYKLLDVCEPDSAGAVQANHWLDEFGRDPLREGKAKEAPTNDH